MDEIEDLPFKVGQEAEARSFISGFRGAWFRCKIKEIKRPKGQISLSLEYFDFPDEGIKRTKLFQVPPSNGGKSKETDRVLMVRPCYPTLLKETDLPDITTISEVIVTYDGIFKIGDLVDWWKDDCYWSAKITKVLANGLLQIELPPRPQGEGYSYEVSSKDLRPSLDWDPIHGWRVPCSNESKNSRMCARLIQPADKAAEGLVNTKINAVDEVTEDLHATAFTLSASSNNSSKKRRTKEKPRRSLSRTASVEAAPAPVPAADVHTVDCATEKMSMLDSSSSSHAEDRYSNESLKRLRDDDDAIPLNSTKSDSIEAAITDLEEVVNKVKWLKGIIQFGIPLPNDVRPAWKFVEHRASSTSK